MTVADLIRELQALPPHVPVRVVPSEVWHPLGDAMMPLCDEDATEADEVRYEGAYVLIRGK